MSRCWLCGSDKSFEALPSGVTGEVTSDDFKISDSHYGRTSRIVECMACGFRYADPLPVPELLGMYSSLVDPDYDKGGEGRIEPFRRIIRRSLALRPAAKSLLDVGASTGLMLVAARESGVEAVGVEPSGWAVEVARTRHNVEVIEGVFPNPALSGRRFDIITLLDVIEHVQDPVGLLKDISAALTDDGLAVIVTPDVRSIAARLMGGRWWHYRLAHVCYFDRKTMGMALGKAGLRLERLERYAWTFQLGYLADRLTRYLPVGFIVRGLSRTGLGRRLLKVQVPLDLRDSDTYYARRA